MALVPSTGGQLARNYANYFYNNRRFGQLAPYLAQGIGQLVGQGQNVWNFLAGRTAGRYDSSNFNLNPFEWSTRRVEKIKNYIQRNTNRIRQIPIIRNLFNRRNVGRNLQLADERSGGLLGIESKFLDEGFWAAVPTYSLLGANGRIANICIPDQGSGASQRDGKKIVVTQIDIQGVIEFSSHSGSYTFGDVSSIVYLALVLDQHTNGANFLTEDCFESLTGALGGTTPPFRNLTNSSRFKVLNTSLHEIRIPYIERLYGTTWGYSGATTPFHLHWEGQIPVNYLVTASTGLINDISDNSFHLIAYRSSSTLATTVTANMRSRFVG